MEMPKHTCSFIGGMNKDLSPNAYLNTVYFDAQNLRVITDSSDGMTTSSLVTPKGNLASFTLPTNTTLLGYTTLREFLVILAHDSTVAVLKPDKIYKIPLSWIIGATNFTIHNTSQ
jgi:hypothetical protein